MAVSRDTVRAYVRSRFKPNAPQKSSKDVERDDRLRRRVKDSLDKFNLTMTEQPGHMMPGKAAKMKRVTRGERSTDMMPPMKVAG